MYTAINQQSEIIDKLIEEGLGGRYDTGLIHNEVFAVFGLAPVSDIPDSNFWAIVWKYEIGRIGSWLL